MGHGVVQLTSQTHHENILNSLHQLRQQGYLIDVTVQVGNDGEVQEFPAHQVLLAASSGYFKNTLLSPSTTSGKLLLSNMQPANFSTFLDFIYTGKVIVDKDELGSVQEVAQILDCKELFEICGDAMSFGILRDSKQTLLAAEEVEKGHLHDTDTLRKSRRRSKTKGEVLKRRHSLQNSEAEAQLKRLQWKDAVKDHDVTDKNTTDKMDSHKVTSSPLSTTADICGDADYVTREDMVQNINEMETNARSTGHVKNGEEITASDGEDWEMEEDMLNDNTLSSEEEKDGEAGLSLKRKSKAQFECEKCQRTFHYERSYLKHISTYHGVKTEVVYRCETCQQTFVNRGNLKIHKKHVHNNERLFACDTCKKTFKRKKDVVRHQRQVHERNNLRFVCPDCGKALSSKTALLLHERTHTGAKPFECTECNAKFSQNSALKMHHRTHTGEKPFACDQCDARFTQKHMLCYHQRSHTGERPFMCEACGKSFASKEYLRDHSNIHTGSKPYKCKQCGRGFAQRNSLHQHLKIHTGERPYSCQHCKKLFTQLNALQRHERIHTGEKPFMCGLCKRTFTDKSTFRRHAMTHDTDVPWRTYLVVLEGNVESKKPKSPVRGKAEKIRKGEKRSSTGCGDGGNVDCHATEGGIRAQASTFMVPTESVTLQADWASQGTFALVSHSTLGGITVIHTEVPAGTEIQPIVTTDSTGASVISLDPSAIPFTIPVSMPQAIPLSSHTSSPSLSMPVTLTVPISEATFTSVSETHTMCTSSVLEDAASQTILAPASETEADTSMLEPEIEAVIVGNEQCKTEPMIVEPGKIQRTTTDQGTERDEGTLT